MKYATAGKTVLTEYKLPLVCSDALVWPVPSDGYYGLIFIEEGMLRIEDAVSKKTVPAPAVLFLKPDHTIRSLAGHGGSIHSLVFRPDAVNTNGIPEIPESFFFNPFRELPDSGYTAKMVPPNLVGQLMVLFRKIDENLNILQGDFWPCLSRSFFLELLILLERSKYLSETVPEMIIPETGGQIDPVFEYIHTSYNQKFTLESLASRFATNRTTLNNLFQKACGMTVIAYLNTIRLDVAASLLRNTELPISTIAERTGFADDSYFSRAFRKKTGLPPAAYRKTWPNPYGTAH